MKLTVEGMTCGHCVRGVTAAIHRLEPGAEVSVNLGDKAVVIEGGISPHAAAVAIRAEGYEVTSIEEDSGR